HVSLFSQFFTLMSFNKYQNLFPGISNAIEATTKEEELHGNFGYWILDRIKEENGEWLTKERIEDFERFGATIVNCINREYCKKLIIMLPGQTHPAHYHKKKEETFHLLYGDIRIKLNGVEKDYKAGDMVVIERGMEHSFSSQKGAVLEEISTTHFLEDSYYADAEILKNKNRKTELTFWSDWLTKPKIEI
ncbi:MAG: cupin domain-containing protein, partial [Candidatus Omnitrophica bacterium]|nr:cupin domain-containing protein [Candidatus Omnitrophota bacterium]